MEPAGRGCGCRSPDRVLSEGCSGREPNNRTPSETTLPPGFPTQRTKIPLRSSRPCPPYLVNY